MKKNHQALVCKSCGMELSKKRTMYSKHTGYTLSTKPICKNRNCTMVGVEQDGELKQ